MNKKITEYLERIDLTEQESHVYLLLIESGPISVKDLAGKAGIKRPTAYLYLDQLIEKGLVMKIIKGTNKLVAAVDPEISLKKLVKDKMDLALDMEKQFPSIIERIHDVLPNQTQVSQAEIKYYKGKENARKIYIEALQAKEFRSYVIIDKSNPLFPNNSSVFRDALINNKDLKIWEIIYNKDESIPPSESSRSFKNKYHYKYMKKSQKLSSEDILIYDNKVAIINLGNNHTSIVLHSPELYNNFKDIFGFLWEVLPEPREI